MNAMTYRELAVSELARLAEIDHRELIPAIYSQNGAQLTEEAREFDVPPWAADGDHEHGLAYQRAFCERHLAAGGTALGAFDDDRLVGICKVRS